MNYCNTKIERKQERINLENQKSCLIISDVQTIYELWLAKAYEKNGTLSFEINKNVTEKCYALNVSSRN